MQTSLTSSATTTLNNAQYKANTAAQTIANLSVQNNEVGGSKDVGPGDLFKPIVSLKEAELETSAGVKLLQAEKNTLGALLNVNA